MDQSRSEDVAITVDSTDTIKPHNGEPVTKMVISPQSKCIVTYSQDDKSFVCWSIDDDNKSLKCDSTLFAPEYFRWHMNFKVSDEKIIILNEEFVYDMNDNAKSRNYDIMKTNNYCEKKDKSYDNMENRSKIFGNERFGVKCDFLTNGNIVKYHKDAISIYSSSDWRCKARHELDEKDKIFCGVTNDRLLVLVDNNLFVLDLSELSKIHYLKVLTGLYTFQYWKILDVKDEKIMLKRTDNLTVIHIGGTLRIYSNSNNINAPIKVINNSKLVQDFGIIHNIHNDDDNHHNNNDDDDEYIITKLSDDITIHSWKNNLTSTINISKLYDDNSSQFIHMEFKGNEAHLYSYDGEKWDVRKYCWEYWKKLLEDYNEQIEQVDENTNSDKRENVSNSKRVNDEKNESKMIFSYDTKLSSHWEYKKVCDNILLFRDAKELRIYTFDMEFRIRYFNIEFLNYATNRRKLDKLDDSDIDEIVKPIENDRLKKQWVSYLLNQRDFLVRYGSKLLKSAIEKNNEDLIREIIDKTLEYYKRNQNLNIYLLSIICENMNHLSRKYSDFLLDYYNKIENIENIEKKISTTEYIYNNFDHIYSFYIELKSHNSIFNFISRTFSENRKDHCEGHYKEHYKDYCESSGSICCFDCDSCCCKICKYFFRSCLFCCWCCNGICIICYLCCCDCCNYIFPLCTFIIMVTFYILSYTKQNTSFLIIAIVFTIFAIFLILSWSKLISKLKSTLNSILKPDRKPKIKLIVPFPNYLTYPKEYNSFEEFLNPKPSPFSNTRNNNEFYKTWNGEAIINFKWSLFGKHYYALIWFLFTTFLVCFTLASSVSSKAINAKKNDLLISSIILGFVHLSFEIRQFIWNPKEWILNVWNLIDLGAYLLPTITSIYWLQTGIKVTHLISISCLLLDIKFLLFFRAFETFGIYFAIIIGVGQPKSKFSENDQGDLNDPNNPWVLTTKYHQISDNGTISHNAVLVEEPDDYTNLFSSYANSLLAVYLFLIGDKNSLDAWSPDNTIIIVLMVIFTSVIVVYLMNLFIGLLNMAIEKDQDRAFYLAQKAEILKDIELFYLFPYQRRRTDWFPDIIYYYANVNEVRKKLQNERKGSEENV
ncbi:hypothetical protein GLOIN_2v1841250 [Rhizophagus clarus]|uniref:Ion transport domain-containing protein n=1 Tax=Rhizophagus clarus TaxID=94130 RepID=A0A8H3R203_9GLOM|nr:hypothetical protein GLOIN_2v1841250 [Rhizophagus clarus]